jgi:hypothetical protein
MVAVLVHLVAAVLVHLVAAVLLLLIIVHHLLMMVEEGAVVEADVVYHNITKKYIMK